MIKQWHSINAAWNLMEQKEREILRKQPSRSVGLNATYPSSSVYYQHIGLFRLDVIYVTPIDIFDSHAAIPDFAHWPPPDFSHWQGGLNDRLFYGLREYAKILATQRFDSLQEYLQEDSVKKRDWGVHSETFVAWLMRAKNVPVEMKDICIWRTRPFPLKIRTLDCDNGCGKKMTQMYEDFASNLGVPLERQEVYSGYSACAHVKYGQCYRYSDTTEKLNTAISSVTASYQNATLYAMISGDNAHRVESCMIQRNISLNYVPNEPNATTSVRKGSLYLITPTSRPYLLSQSIFHVLKMKACFDVKWIILHSTADSRLYREPFFRNVFSWITELSTYHNQSRDGNHERNVGIEHAIKDSRCDLDLVYFLNDDNILPDNICNWENLQYLSAHSADQLISAKQFRTNGEVHTIPGLCWNSLQVVKGNLFTDTGAWFIPVYILKQFNTNRWILNVDSGDSHFYTNLAFNLLTIQTNRNDTKVVVELPDFAFKYKALHGSQWKTPSVLWDKVKLN
jgi:hypothetical protein